MSTSSQVRLDRMDEVFRLVNLLPGDEFAAHPACDDPEIDPELFQPISEAHTSQIARARQVCASCPVQGSCLQFALRTGEDHGIWGGLTAGERRRLRLTRGGEQGEHEQDGSEGACAA